MFTIEDLISLGSYLKQAAEETGTDYNLEEGLIRFIKSFGEPEHGYKRSVNFVVYILNKILLDD